MQNKATPELYQFCFSNFNEKVRWALDYKLIPHSRHSLLPGAHIPKAMWLSGQKSVPIVRIGNKVFSGSANIIEELEQRYPERSLFPRSFDDRRQAHDIIRWFDEVVGPATRRTLFHEILPARKYSADLFSQSFSKPVRTGYRLLFPGLVPILKMDMSINKKNHKKGLALTEEALDYIADNAGEDGYLIGDRFTVADLTAASLLFITCFPPEIQFKIDRQGSSEIQGWLNRWSDHPGTTWIKRMYHRHRGSSAAIS